MKNETKKHDELHDLITQNIEQNSQSPKALKKGEVVEGSIVSVAKGIVLVDVGGKSEGIVSGKELATKIKQDISIGNTVMVYVVDPEDKNGQIILSLRRTDAVRKWYALEEARKSDKAVEVSVTEANNGGVLVDIEGVAGFIPTSQLDPVRVYKSDSESNLDIQKVLVDLVGTRISAKIMELDKEKNRVILSEKLAMGNQTMEERENTLKKIKTGDILNGTISGITTFGLFVNAQGLEGLVHLSEISWDKVENPGDLYKTGDKVQVQLIGMSDNGKRIAYSIKKLQMDPWSKAMSKYKIGNIVHGQVTKYASYGAFVKVDEGLNGLIHLSELSNELVMDPKEVVKIGDKIDVMIIAISPNERHLSLSLRRAKENKETEVTESK